MADSDVVSSEPDVGGSESGAENAPPRVDRMLSEDSGASNTTKMKIDILLKATGNAPIMKKKKWAVDAEKQIGWIIEFIKKYLKLDAKDTLFLYVNQTFAPAPDQIVRNLYECYGTDGKLILHYCKSQAWG